MSEHFHRHYDNVVAAVWQAWIKGWLTRDDGRVEQFRKIVQDAAVNAYAPGIGVGTWQAAALRSLGASPFHRLKGEERAER